MELAAFQEKSCQLVAYRALVNGGNESSPLNHQFLSANQLDRLPPL